MFKGRAIKQPAVLSSIVYALLKLCRYLSLGLRLVENGADRILIPPHGDAAGQKQH